MYGSGGLASRTQGLKSRLSRLDVNISAQKQVDKTAFFTGVCLQVSREHMTTAASKTQLYFFC